jgi:lipopolysaccharide biosynthesis glycosyltransferase
MDDIAPVSACPQHSDSLAVGAQHIHTLLCTNAGFLQHAAICMVSLVANNPNKFFDFVVVHQPAETLDEGRLRRSLAQFPNHSVVFRSFGIPPDLVLPLNPAAHYTLDTYVRLWVEEFFPPEVTRVLYLDADLVVVGDIAPLWNVDLGGALMGAVDIPGSERGVTLLGIKSEDGYFNAGMLVIDLQQWRSTGAGTTVLEYIQRNPERVLYDQDALNACFHGCTKRLDYKWNVIRPFYREPIPLPLSREQIERIRREAVIIHFNGSSKPWSYFSDHPARGEYYKYLHMTEWRDYVPPDRTPINMVRKAVSTILPQPLKNVLKSVLIRKPA